MEQTVLPLLPIFLFLLCAIGLALGLLVIARIFNPGRSGRVKRMPYESGMDPIHDTRRRFDVRFHLLAIAFLVFDVELLFLFPWAVASRSAVTAGSDEGSGIRGQGSANTGTSGLAGPAVNRPLPLAVSHPAASRHLIFAGVMTFVVLLTVGFVYDWRKGVFQWR